MRLKNVFSMENSEEEILDTGAADIEVVAIEAEGEVTEELDSLDTLTDDTEEAVADIEDLEVVEETLEEEVESEESEGMTEIAAESINTLLAGIERRYGFESYSARNALARENFSGSVSMRRRNSEHALEAIKDAISNLWEKIKAAINKVWEWVKSFWNKHLSTLGRLKKSLEAMRKRVRDTKGNPESEDDVTVPGGLQALFYSADDATLTASVIDGFIASQTTAAKNVGEFLDKVQKSFVNMTDSAKKNHSNIVYAGITNTRKTLDKGLGNGLAVGTEDDPLVGGFYGTVKIDEDGRNDDGKVPKIIFDKDTRKTKTNNKRHMELADKNTLLETIGKAISLIDATTNLDKDFSKAEKDRKEAEKQLTDAVKKMKQATEKGKERKKEGEKDLQDLLKLYRNVSAVAPTVLSNVISLNIQCAKGVVRFSAKTLSYYKQED